MDSARVREIERVFRAEHGRAVAVLTRVFGEMHVYLVITPQIEGVRMLEWQQRDRARAMGREAAKAALDQAGELIASWSPR